MNMKKTIKDYDLNGKKVIIRCDFNIPMNNGIILDDTRIRASIKTIRYAINNGASVILLSHLGRVKTDEDKKCNSLYPVSLALSNILKKEVLFSPETRGKELSRMVSELQSGDILLVENTRFEDIDGNKESKCDKRLSKYWASLGDIYINDAYGTCHRNHASVTGIPLYIPSGIGFLVEREIKKINGILELNTHPFITILGGKKIEDKTKLIESLVKISDKLIIGGAMSFTFLKVLGYNTGKCIISEDNLSFCKKILDNYKEKIILPVDFVCEDAIKEIDEFDDNDIGYDIGPKTIRLFDRELKDAKRVILNGPMGMFEDSRYANGTRKVFNILGKYKIKTVIGGGDSASAVNNLGFNDLFYHVSTGGGATMKYLEDRKLAGIEVIEDAEK